MRILHLATILLGLELSSWADEQQEIVFETDLARLTVSPDARTTGFVDRNTGRDWLRGHEPVPFAAIRAEGRDIPATLATFTNSTLTLRFGTNGPFASVHTDVHPQYVLFRVDSVSAGGVDTLTFLNVPLDLQGRPNEPFGACVLALNLHTRVDALPALQRELKASCEKVHGLTGARVALVAAPMGRMLAALQTALAEASELPVCQVAGPWARDIPFNHGSYLFNFGTLVETNVDEWISTVQDLGFTQIDNHGGGSFFRFGDLELNREKWPDGWETWRRIVARLHARGIGSIFHTYGFFIDKRSRYVTPVPDARLDAFRTFTLAEPLSAEATELTVRESTTGLTTVTGFFEQNSVVLHVGDELITFGDVSRTAPWRFTGLQRGALGTRASAHDRDTKARHLKECFGLFVPDAESTLFEEIAANHADVVNRCDFDGIYLDAIDGSSILRGNDACWYWANKFVVEIQKRLRKPVGMEMSAMWHQFWQYRTRWQAWDFPRRGQQRFIDLHAEGVNGGLMLPLHLGWWTFQAFNPPQTEPTYPDVIENLGAKLIGWDAGISLTSGVDRNALRNTPLFRRDVEILRTCEELRHSRRFDETTRARLREPGREFTLERDSEGRARFRPVQSSAHTAALAEPWTLGWTVTNGFAAQPVRLRLEALMSTDPAATNAVDLMRVAQDVGTSWTSAHANGVTTSETPGPGATNSSWSLAAANSGTMPRRAAWGRWERRFEPLLNLKDREALEVAIEGDGSGAMLAVRLESPSHLAYGAVRDHYVDLDFRGTRRITLVESEAARWSDFDWNDAKGLYQVYRESIEFGAVERIGVWLHNLPGGRASGVRLTALRAIPLRPVPVRNPRIRVGGNWLEFPVELTPGSWIEANGPADCTVYGAKGETLGRITPKGEWPTLKPGDNAVAFAGSEVGGAPGRARLTFFPHGDPL